VLLNIAASGSAYHPGKTGLPDLKGAVFSWAYKLKPVNNTWEKKYFSHNA
jgi:hypothetical protein